jgi:hypothetical protein
MIVYPDGVQEDDDSPSGYPCDPWDEHVFEETHYGHTCKKCGLFYAEGCAPWEDNESDDE